MMPLACANCCEAASQANWKPAVSVTRLIVASSPVRKCQPRSLPGRW
jgi:hypothetical protein